MKPSTYRRSFIYLFLFICRSNVWIGHVGIDHLLDDEHPPVLYDLLWDGLISSLGCRDAFVVREFGSENGHAHYHFYLECSKGKSCVYAKLRLVFSRAGCPSPGQQVSCKAADPVKLPEYFVYLCKGPQGKPMELPFLRLDLAAWIIVDKTKSRMVEAMHLAFHEKARSIRDVKSGKKSPSAWYETLALECRACGSTTRDDVMQVVSRYYVYESKKGFDKFAVTRTFWAVFALVNGMACHELLLGQCMDMVRS